MNHMQPSDDTLAKEDTIMDWALLIICTLTNFPGSLAKYFALETAPLKTKSNSKERTRNNAY
jgi:hypothetical protein